MEPVSILLGLAQFAPQLIKWVTGNDTAEKVAAVAVDVANTVAGTKDVGSAIDKLKANAELAAQFADKINEREHELTMALLADVSNARSMQIAALQQDDVFSKRFIYLFSIAWSGYAMWFMYYASYVQPMNKDNANLVLGFLLGTAVSSIFGFFYGSTARSNKKDETIMRLSGK